MITAEDIIEEYTEHYECSKKEAIEMALEDMKLAEKELREELIKIKEVNDERDKV